jgi:hypothetical protein
MLARELGIPVLDGESLTEAHWWSSWDGLHYSEMGAHFAKSFSKQLKRWNGGTSMMATQTLINKVCNQPCNPIYAHLAKL